MEDRTLTLSKHEVVIDRDMLEEIMQYSNRALAWDKLYESIEVPNQSETDKALGAIFINPDDTEENYFLREKMIRILREVEDE